jgi:hypothetical protein
VPWNQTPFFVRVGPPLPIGSFHLTLFQELPSQWFWKAPISQVPRGVPYLARCTRPTELFVRGFSRPCGQWLSNFLRVNRDVGSNSDKSGSGKVLFSAPSSNLSISPERFYSSPPLAPPHLERHSHSPAERSRGLLHHSPERWHRVFCSKSCTTSSAFSRSKPRILRV